MGRYMRPIGPKDNRSGVPRAAASHCCCQTKMLEFGRGRGAMGADFRIEAARTDEARRDAYRLRYTVLVGDLGYDIMGMTAAKGIVERADAKATILLAYD